MQDTHEVMREAAPPKMGTGSGPKQKRIISPLNGAELPIGRPLGVPNRLTRTLKEAVELAARDCHPEGLAGWLVDRANGSVQDRAIFAGLVGKVIPIQVQQSVEGGITINLGWLAGRGIGTSAAQAQVIDAQVVEAIEHSPPSHWTSTAEAEAQPVDVSAHKHESK